MWHVLTKSRVRTVNLNCTTVATKELFNWHWRHPSTAMTRRGSNNPLWKQNSTEIRSRGSTRQFFFLQMRNSICELHFWKMISDRLAVPNKTPWPHHHTGIASPAWITRIGSQRRWPQEQFDKKCLSDRSLRQSSKSSQSSNKKSDHDNLVETGLDVGCT